MKRPLQAILDARRVSHLSGQSATATTLATALVFCVALLLAGCQAGYTPPPSQGGAGQHQGQHQGLLERGPRAAVVGTHGTYNIAWITIQDQVLLQKPVYELLVTYHPTNRGPGGVKDHHWAEMMQVAEAEIARRCPPPGEPQILQSSRDHDTRQRAMGAEIRVTYACP